MRRISSIGPLVFGNNQKKRADDNAKIRKIKNNTVEFGKGGRKRKIVHHISPKKAVISIAEGTSQQ